MEDQTAEEQKTFCLRIDGELWESFKKTVTRDKSLNAALNEMIAERIVDVLGESHER